MKKDGKNGNDVSNGKHPSHDSHSSHSSEPLLPRRGDYQTLLSFQKAEIVHDITFRRTPQTYEDYRKFVETRPPEIVANIALCLIHQTN